MLRRLRSPVEVIPTARSIDAGGAFLQGELTGDPEDDALIADVLRIRSALG